jgi:predicted phosphate transport protein (TIGR00153 family)
MSSFSCEAATFLRETFREFEPGGVNARLDKMHSIEHDGDVSRHSMTKLLAKEFITPIEREDIMQMSEAIDNVTDKIEDVLQRVYMFNIQEIRKDAIVVADVIVKCTEAMRDMLDEFHNFKKSKIIGDRIIEINRLEEVGDRLYIDAVRSVFLDDNLLPVQTIAWTDIFSYMEEVCDACEDVADVVEGVIMKNS